MKNVIITGTSRGIGFELARQFSEAGHKVLALSRNVGPLSLLKLKHVNSPAFDIANTEDIEQIKQHLQHFDGKVDILINNAGFLVNKPFPELTAADFENSYRVNLFGPVALIKAVLPFMATDGHVVNISSMGGVQGSVKFPGLSAYSSSKGAVLTLTELLAEEYKATGPSFNALALGSVQTEMLEEAFPGLQAPVSATEMARYIMDFSLTGHKFYNGKILQVSSTTP